MAAHSDFPWKDEIFSKFLTTLARANIITINTKLSAHVNEMVTNAKYKSYLAMVEVKELQFQYVIFYAPTITLSGCKLIKSGNGCNVTANAVVQLGFSHSGKIITDSDVNFDWTSGSTWLKITGDVTFRMATDDHLKMKFVCSDVALDAGGSTVSPLSMDLSKIGYTNAAYWKGFTSNSLISAMADIATRTLFKHYQDKIKSLLTTAIEYDVGVFPLTSSRTDPTKWLLEMIFWMGVDRRLNLSLQPPTNVTAVPLGNTSWLKKLMSATQTQRDDMLTKAVNKLMPAKAFDSSDGTTLTVKPGELNITTIVGDTDADGKLTLKIEFEWKPTGQIRMKVKKQYGIGGHITMSDIFISGKVILRVNPNATPLMTASLLDLKHSVKAISNNVIIKLVTSVQKKVDNAIEKFTKGILGAEQVIVESW